MSQPTAHLLALADFNDARLDEDELTAREATPGPWAPDEPLMADYVTSALLGYVADCSVGTGYRPQSIPDARHIARHDPARVLREVEAKRLLIANWRKLILKIDAEPDPGQRERLALTRHGLDQVAFQLAAAHCDHPAYQEGWRP